MTPMLQTGFGAILLALSYVLILAGSTLAFVIVETKCDVSLRKGEGKREEEEQEAEDGR